jgi:hypothetical protein
MLLPLMSLQQLGCRLIQQTLLPIYQHEIALQHHERQGLP